MGVTGALPQVELIDVDGTPRSFRVIAKGAEIVALVDATDHDPAEDGWGFLARRSAFDLGHVLVLPLDEWPSRWDCKDVASTGPGYCHPGIHPECWVGVDRPEPRVERMGPITAADYEDDHNLGHHDGTEADTADRCATCAHAVAWRKPCANGVDGDECAMVRERTIAGIKDVWPVCPVHGVHPLACPTCGHDGYDAHDMRSVPPACVLPGCPCGHGAVAS